MYSLPISSAPFGRRPLSETPWASLKTKLIETEVFLVFTSEFYAYAIFVTKCFYVWAKHYIGFFLNYVRFMDRLTFPQQKNLYLLEIFSSMATTTSVFLHTLKFKKYIGPRTSFFIYAASYFATFYGFITSYDIFLR